MKGYMLHCKKLTDVNFYNCFLVRFLLVQCDVSRACCCEIVWQYGRAVNKADANRRFLYGKAMVA